jgi:caffeoyl-CoA O-methyltransferase
MFHSISPEIQAQMDRLERIDARDRHDGTPRLERLRQIPPETGKFLAITAANTPAGQLVEIGASAGYSTLWLSLAARESHRRITTFEILPAKVALARETFAAAGVEDVVSLVEGDARNFLGKYREIAFCFLDAEKEDYGESYEAVIPNLVQGGLLVADNANNFRETLQLMLDRAMSDIRVDALIVDIGNGLLVCRKS